MRNLKTLSMILLTLTGTGLFGCGPKESGPSDGSADLAAGRTGADANPGGGGGTSTTGSGGTVGTAGASGAAGSAGTAGRAGVGGAAGRPGSGGSAGNVGMTGSGGTPGTGGAAGGTGAGGRAGTGGRGGTTGTAGAGGLPQLTVSGTKLQDPAGKTIILRGTSLIDIGALYAYGGNSAAGITTRIDKVAGSGLQGHAIRLPVYPKIAYNGGFPTCSPLPYPVGTGPAATCTPTMPMNAADYVTRVLKPAVDYATSKNLYVIIDYHQIDNAAAGTSAADATTFWTDVAPRFANYANVLYEPFNEPIDTTVSWTAFKPVVQGWIDTIRSRAPNNIIIVPSMNWDQVPGTATGNPPTGTNLMYTAHIYPGNWSQAFQSQLSTALTRAPVFITEWGYIYSTTQMDTVHTSSTTWGSTFRGVVDGNGASWIAWVTDNAWVPNMYSDTGLTQLTAFGDLVKTWLAAKATSDWVQ